LTEDGLAEHLFDVANQLNRGAELLADHDEKVRVAAIDLRAGRKAKASAAYTSARKHFAAGMALLDEGDWSSQYELQFSLWLERAECELLIGDFDTAGELIEGLIPRAMSKVDNAAVYHLKVQLYLLKSEPGPAVDAALACLRGFGIAMPAHPTEEEVRTEYKMVWDALNTRSIESLIDLPLMTDRELQAAMKVLSVVTAAAYFFDFRLFCFQSCSMVRVSIQHGMSGDFLGAYCYLGVILGSVFHRYNDGYRFAKLACDLVDKHEFIATRAKVYVVSAVVAGWTQPLGTAVDFTQAGFRAAREGGDPAFGCYGMSLSIIHLLLRNDPLDTVWRESEMAMDFARNARYDDGTAMFVSQQRFIATMQGRTANFSTFSDAQFDEATFEAQITGSRNPAVSCWYWILKLKARFLSGDFAEAWAIAGKAKQLLRSAIGRIEMLEYIYYTALTVAALYETASADQQAEWWELLMEHREQLREWAENYPPTFADKYTLILAEVARLEKRDADALRLYEQAIHSARESGFVQNEGLAHELAARYYLARGLETAGYAHLRNARNCYDRWGAHGKVKQLDERHPRLREGRALPASATIGPPVGLLDVETVVKASQAISSEMVLPVLIEKLVRIAVESAGAERGLLILVRSGEPRIEAEATTGPGGVEVAVRQSAVTSSDLLQAALHYALRTQERVLLDDAAADNVYSKDESVQRKRPKSVLCLPIVKQAKLVGALYLENNLTPTAFTPDRVTVLQWLASQAAISLENASLYSDLQRSEAFLAQSQSELRQIMDFAPQHVYVLGSDPESMRIYVNRAALDYLGLTLQEWRARDRREIFHPDDWELAIEAQGKIAAGLPHEVEIRLRGKDGKYRWFLSRRNPLRDEHGNLTHWYIAAADIEDRKAAEQRLEDENVSLREEIDKSSMFEEIVGTSAPLKKVLSRVSKVAPTDSSVLITGETGTGKELVARAIHRRSQRSSHAFVSVNCAVIPRDLIASELFGHEKGAFTGATQRRLGRFELAEKGTIFLDEVGELPAETQIALLRVLQEREFERIGGTGGIRADVRVIAATNRDLESAIESGKFRRDLFYRLNVFPLELPPLRTRSEDIPLLVTYFLNRYARKAGKHFTAVDKKSLDLLQAYAWPGNIRELQNVIERSVIVNETETFSVDESWLSRQHPPADRELLPSLLKQPPDQEKTIIEAALRECGGRVYGPSGAAAKLGMPRSTLESKIRSLNINKNRFKGTDPLE
jgi:PAS domain S-box-containing protein